MRCPDCGEDNAARARFCLSCGAALEAASARELRKTVTIVFCDLSGSTALGERLDPESLRRVQLRYFEAMRTALERHGGIVEKYIGDAVMAVFGIPRVHEDDALRAVRAAQDMLEELAALNAELERDHGVTLQVRIGVNTGPVVSGDPEAGRALVTGDAVNVAARLEQAAAPGEILLGEATHRLVRDAVLAEERSPVEAKGKSEPVRAWRLVSVLPGAEAVARRLDVPIVGRERELRLLREAFERAATERACVLLTILGAPGVGKSRLVEEFLGGIDAEVLRGRCLPYGEGITYWPVVEMLTRRARISDRDPTEQVGEKLRGLVGSDPEGELVAERLAQLFGTAGVPVAAEETFWALRRLLEALARTSPVIVDHDDVQWAEPTLVDLIEYLGAWTREAPILLLCSARPDLLDTRPSWGSTVPGSTSIELEPLPTEEAERLAAEHLVGAPREVAERIAEVAEGVPLFVEQLAAMLVDDGTLTREDGGWAVRADLASIRVPPTVAALIDARLERLPPEELDVLEHAAVEGKGFHRGAVLALTPEDARDQVSARLLSLLRRGLIRPAARLGAAGRRAFERGDLRGAGSLLSRADALLPPSAVGRAEIQLALGTVHEREGRYGEALAELATAERLAREADDVGTAARAVARRQFVRSHVEETPQVELQAEVGAYLPELEAAGEETAIAEACLFLGVSSLWLGRETLATELLERARVLAARVGARWVASEAASWLPAVMATSPMPAVAVVERWRELSGSIQMSRGTRAVGDFLCAPAVAMTGDLDAARAGYRGAREVLAELGHEVSLYASTMMAAQVELLDGELSAAEELLVEGDRALERLGEAGYRSTVLCFLADSLQAQGRAEEAIGATERAEGISFLDDIETNSGWRSARARALADLGSFGEAERLAREAIDVLAPTESLDLQSRSWTSLGYVLASAGLSDEALEAYREALGLLERKANVLSAARVRRTMAILRGDDPPPAELPPGAWGTTWPLGP